MLAAMPAMKVTAVTSRNGNGHCRDSILSLVAPGTPALPSLSSLNRLTPAKEERRRELQEAAVSYAKNGWRVVPVRHINDEGLCSHCPRGTACESEGKHPIHDDWPDVATSDPDKVAHWWRPSPEETLPREWFPEANIGILTGAESGIFVLDVDPRNGGEETLGGHERRNGGLPETRIHHTGSGGVHFFFRHPGFPVRNDSKGKVLGKGLDIKGERGFVVAPPSVSAKGQYELNPAHDIEPAEAPQWLLDRLRKDDDRQSGIAVPGDDPDTGLPHVRRYVESTLRGEAQKVRDAEPGTRNDTLNSAAFALGTLGGAGYLSEDQAWNALREPALASGLGDGEIRSTFLSGWRAGLKEPRQIEWRTAADGESFPARPWNDIGNTYRMVDHWSETLRFCPERDTWMTYQGGVWTSCREEVATDRALSMIASLEMTEAAAYSAEREPDKDGNEMPSPREKFLDWVKKQTYERPISAAARMARGRPAMRISANTFDGGPDLLNVRNGVIDLRTGELLPHDPELRMTMQCAAAYDPEAIAPRWEDFLAEVQPDPEMRAYLRRVAGYSATGRIDEQVFFIHHGTGANGKSVFQAVMSGILGQHAQAVPAETLLLKRNEGAIPNDVARMQGRRFLAASETKQGKKLDEQRLKSLTGGETISARFMRAEWFDFRPTGKPHLFTNYRPHVSDDEATWRRIHDIDWPVHVAEERRDGTLAERLVREEAAGILVWIVQGAMEWYTSKLRMPAAAQESKAQYRHEEDRVKRFIEECLVPVPAANGRPERSTRAIHQEFERWVKAEHETSMSQTALTQAIKRSFPGKKDGGYVRANGWSGFPELAVRGMGF